MTERIVITQDCSRVITIRDGGIVGANRPLSYKHTQTTPAQVWLVQHNLGFDPGGVIIFNNAVEEIVEEQRTYPNSSALILSFPEPVAGTVYLS